jgi:hypothetical protein
MYRISVQDRPAIEKGRCFGWLSFLGQIFSSPTAIIVNLVYYRSGIEIHDTTLVFYYFPNTICSDFGRFILFYVLT